MVTALSGPEAAEAIHNPFFMLAPDIMRLPLVILAMLATFIASQAVISGAFSVTHQAMQLGFIPRLSIRHTSETEAGQIYIPAINWALMVAVILLVLTFQNSSNLASAYGIAVTGAMLIDTCLMAVLLLAVWRWKLVAGGAGRGGVLHRRRRLFRGQRDQGARRRLVPAADRRGRLYPADHLGQGPQADARTHDRGGAADRNLRQVRHQFRHRACPARRSSWRRARRAFPRRCCTISSTTRCCTNASWC